LLRMAVSKAAKGGCVEPPWFDNVKRNSAMWYIYILECADGSLYTGSTTDMSRRLKEHNSGQGGNYTRMRYPVKLLLTEPHQSRSLAQKREAQIKRWTRDKKLALIHDDEPALKKLSESRD
jgi:putative endonuclease